MATFQLFFQDLPAPLYVLYSAWSLRHFILPWLGNRHISDPLPSPLTQQPKIILAFNQFKLFVRMFHRGLKSIRNDLLQFPLSVFPPNQRRFLHLLQVVAAPWWVKRGAVGNHPTYFNCKTKVRVLKGWRFVFAC